MNRKYLVQAYLIFYSIGFAWLTSSTQETTESTTVVPQTATTEVLTNTNSNVEITTPVVTSINAMDVTTTGKEVTQSPALSTNTSIGPVTVHTTKSSTSSVTVPTTNLSTGNNSTVNNQNSSTLITSLQSISSAVQSTSNVIPVTSPKINEISSTNRYTGQTEQDIITITSVISKSNENSTKAFLTTETSQTFKTNPSINSSSSTTFATNLDTTTLEMKENKTSKPNINETTSDEKLMEYKDLHLVINKHHLIAFGVVFIVIDIVFIILGFLCFKLMLKRSRMWDLPPSCYFSRRNFKSPSLNVVTLGGKNLASDDDCRSSEDHEVSESGWVVSMKTNKRTADTGV